jgi:uncharacterized protein YqgC (DUF456 family)
VEVLPVSGLEFFSQGVVLFITLFLMMVGLVMVLIPPIPGTVIIWAAALFYGVVLGWEQLGWLTFSLLTFLMLAGLVVDIIAGHFGAKLGGGSCLAIVVGAVSGFILGFVFSLIGTPVLGCFAGLIGMSGGMLLIEWKRNNDWDTAVGAVKGYMAGSVAGIMARVTSGFFMVGLFVARVYWG